MQAVVRKVDKKYFAQLLTKCTHVSELKGSERKLRVVVETISIFQMSGYL